MSAAALPVVSCAGAPRDLGLDQGRATTALLQELGGASARAPSLWRGLRLAVRAASASRWGVRDPALAAVARDLERHFPQLAERLDGLAVGARIERAALLRTLRAALGDTAELQRGATAGPAVALRIAGEPPRALLLTSLARGSAVVRRSRPENGLRSLELVAPWSVGGLCGVNEAGLAVASAPADAGARGWPRCAAPAVLLAQECLQRFADVGGATAWCRARPAGGAASILLADAAGNVGAVVVDGERRLLRSAEDGVLASAGAGAEAIVAGAKPLREGDRTDAALEAALAALRDAVAAHGTPSAVALDPSAREIRWLAQDGTLGRLEA